MDGAVVQSKFVMVDDIRTHYLEAGAGEPLILLHSGEFGGCAELSWEYNIEALAEHFHVYAPDWLGYGYTDKLFSFDDMFDKRVRHIRRFMETLCIDSAHFMGNSMGGSTLATVAATVPCPWNLRSIVIVSGGGEAPENEARQILNSYDCTREHMRKLLDAVFIDKKWVNDEYVERRYQLSLIPGAWECTAAVRFKSPVAVAKGKRRPRTYETIAVPTLIVVGAQDTLREPGYYKVMEEQIAQNQVHVFANAGHCPHIECAEEFNRVAIQFLKAHTGTS